MGDIKMIRIACGAVKVDQWAGVGSLSGHPVSTSSYLVQAVQEDHSVSVFGNIFRRLLHWALALVVPAVNLFWTSSSV